MKQFLNQWSKDFKQTVYTPVFFTLAGLYCVILGFVFPRRLFEFALVAGVSPLARGGMGNSGYNIYETVFINHLSLTHLLLLFIVPILTMRLIAEEKKLRTFDLLMTAPITSTKIVLGKFVAGYSAVLLLVLASFLFPFLTGWFADFSLNLLISAYTSITLLVGIYTAIGLFSSSLTESIMLSVFMGIAFNVSLHFISIGAQFSDNTIYSAVIQYISVSSHLEGFFRGNIITSSIVFFILAIGFFLFLTQRVIESSRWRP